MEVLEYSTQLDPIDMEQERGMKTFTKSCYNRP